MVKDIVKEVKDKDVVSDTTGNPGIFKDLDIKEAPVLAT